MKFLFSAMIMVTAWTMAGAQIKNIFQKEIDMTRHKPEEVIDSVYGIQRYDIYAKPLGGDSVRNCSGYSCQGFKEDFYTGESLLHKGYYENGQVAFFKNYYPDGQLEREYKSIDVFRGRLITYWPDGKIKSDGTYREGDTQKYIEYFQNGQVFVSEELHRSMEYYIHSYTYFEDGRPSSSLILVNPKKLLYEKSEYHENGKIRVKGELVFSKEAFDYLKHGNWTEYDESGNPVKELVYEEGAVVREKSL